MIETLHISNYALIDRLDVELPAGFSALTGETGAGKSIIIGALGLLLGGRAEARVVRDPSQKSVVEATFTGIADDVALQQVFKQHDLDWDAERCVVRREVKTSGGDNGRSRAFINDTPVSVACLRDVGMRLVDIHSQNNSRLLQEEAFQISLLDAIADHNEALEQYRQAYTLLKKNLARYRRASKEAAENRKAEDSLRRIVEELTQLKPVEGEFSQLEHEQRKLSDVVYLRTHASEAAHALDGSAGAISALRSALQAVEHIAGSMDNDENIPQRLESALVDVEDVLATIKQFEDELEDNPRYLQYVEERIDTYNQLARELSTTPDGLAECLVKMQARLDGIVNSEAVLAKLRAEVRTAKEAAVEAAAVLTNNRKEASQFFKKEILGNCRPPGMPNLAVEIAMEPTDLGPAGADKVTFMFAFNKSQTPMPVGGTASGGEISRLMLSIKAIVADRMNLPVMIFDEIDTGVSGSIAAGMGQMMRRIAAHGDTQVLAITHLPQVAASALTHFKVYKTDTETTTLTSIERLDDARRVEELALMLSGRRGDDAAMAAARSLLQNGIE